MHDHSIVLGERARPLQMLQGRVGKGSAFERFLIKGTRCQTRKANRLENAVMASSSGSSQSEATQAPRKWVTVSQLAKSQTAFTENSIRYLIYAAKSRKRSLGRGALGDIPGNGLSHAIRKVGRRVLIDELAFIQWVEAHNSIGA